MRELSASLPTHISQGSIRWLSRWAFQAGEYELRRIAIFLTGSRSPRAENGRATPWQEGGKSVALKEAVPKPEDDEDISIDFSKIKAFFRGKKKEGDSGERKVKAASK